MYHRLMLKYAAVFTILGGAAFPVTAQSGSILESKPYHQIIERHAAKHGVPVRLAHAFVKVESNYKFRTRGRLGEVGLMQLLPSTARGIGYKGSMSALYNPETNITWGMKYLGLAYKKAGGDTCKTVMRYQSGLYAKRFSKWNRIYCARVKQYLSTI